jgi:hypothetical protein
MKEYDVDAEFEILYRILDSLREYDHVTQPFNKKCIAYISDKITDLMEPPTHHVDKGHEVMENISSAQHEDELYFPPEDFSGLEVYNINDEI